MIYQLFYWLHIISTVTWLLAFAGSIILAFNVGRSFQTPEEKHYMKLERRIAGIGAHAGALGILISGGVLSAVPGGPQWGWFNFMLYPWLSLKQLLFLIILILVGFSVKRTKAFSKMLGEKQDIPVISITRRAWKKAYKLSIAVYILVVVNTILGLAKPF